MKHALNWNGNDMTLCGLAMEAFEDGLVDAPVEFVEPGRFVTCAECKRVIIHCFTSFTKHFRLKL